MSLTNIFAHLESMSRRVNFLKISSFIYWIYSWLSWLTKQRPIMVYSLFFSTFLVLLFPSTKDAFWFYSLSTIGNAPTSKSLSLKLYPFNCLSSFGVYCCIYCSLSPFSTLIYDFLSRFSTFFISTIAALFSFLLWFSNRRWLNWKSSFISLM